MYWGSIRFFKHLILGIIAFLFLTAVFFAIFFGFKYVSYSSMLLKEIPDEENVLAANSDIGQEDTSSSGSIYIPKDFSSQQVFDALILNGYTANDILSICAKQNPSELIKQYNSILGLSPEQPDYVNLYPNMHVDSPTAFVKEENTVYLTFDDGPSENTLKALEILEKYNIKATFFMCGGYSEVDTEIMQKVAEAGHTIGIHSYCHDYKRIYIDVESFLADFNETSEIIFNATGVKPTIFRFAGGSINSYNQLLYKSLISETSRRGYVYYDWNVSSEDSSLSATEKTIYKNVINGIQGRSRAIVLMHDSTGRESTVNALDDIIKTLIQDGYSFDRLTNEVQPIAFTYILD